MNDSDTGVRSLSYLLVTMAVYLLIWQTAVRFFNFPVYYYARLIEVLAFFLFVALILGTPMRFSEMGIVVSRGVFFRSLALGGGAALLFCSVLALLRFFSDGTVSFSMCLSGDISRITYFLVAPLQEILAKSAMLYGFEMAFGGKHPHLANLMSALTFGIFHVVYGIRMMLLSMLLALFTGWIFRRERCVWGCAVAHFSCGFFPLCFGFC